jgi:hypothetical protein
MNDTTTLPLDGSNYLIDIAARIKTEHQAVAASLKESVRHSIAAGDLLIEAKSQLKHGQWLPWLRDHCTISERTAQLYMRCAKNRAELEKQIRNGVGDLSLNEATALLMMSSDIKKVLDFARRADGMDSEELVKHCAENDIAMFTYHPFGEKYFHELEDSEKLEWLLYRLFLMKSGFSAVAADSAADHLQTRGWRVTMNCDEDRQWYGAWGDRYRKKWFGKEAMSQAAKDDWFALYESNRGRTIEDVEAEIKALADQEWVRRKEQEQAKQARSERRKQKAAAL